MTSWRYIYNFAYVQMQFLHHLKYNKWLGYLLGLCPLMTKIKNNLISETAALFIKKVLGEKNPCSIFCMFQERWLAFFNVM